MSRNKASGRRTAEKSKIICPPPSGVDITMKLYGPLLPYLVENSLSVNNYDFIFSAWNPRFFPIFNVCNILYITALKFTSLLNTNVCAT